MGILSSHPLLPLLTLGGVVLAVLLLDAILTPRRSSRNFGFICLLGALAALSVSLHAWGGEPRALLYGAITSDPFSQLFAVVLPTGCALSMLLALSRSGAHAAVGNSAFYSLALLFGLGAMGACATRDLVVMFASLELVSVATQGLAAVAGPAPSRAEAGVKLTLAALLSSVLFALGIALVFGATGSTHLDALALGETVQQTAASRSLALAGVICVGASLASRLGVFPFHMSLVDATHGFASPVSALMWTVGATAFMAALLRLFAAAQSTLAASWIPLPVLVAASTTCAGNLLALHQRDFKRSLAYLGVSQIGFALLPVAALGAQGVAAAVFHTLALAAAMMGCYALILLIDQTDETRVATDLTGLARRHPLVGAILVVLLASVAGLPPTAGFAARFWVLENSFEAGAMTLAAIGLFNTLLTAYICGRWVQRAYRKTASPSILCLEPPPLAVCALASACCLAAGLWPSALMDVALQVATAL